MWWLVFLLALVAAVAAVSDTAFTVSLPNRGDATTIVLAFSGKVQRAADGAAALRAADFQLAHANGGGQVAILDVSTSGSAVTIAELHIDPGRWQSSADGLLIDVAQAALVAVDSGRIVQQQPTVVKYDGSTFPVAAPDDAASDVQTVASNEGQLAQPAGDSASDNGLLYAGLAGLVVLIALAATGIVLLWRRSRADAKILPSAHAASPARPAFVGELDSSTPASMSISNYSAASSSSGSGSRPGRLAPLPSVSGRPPPAFALETRAAPLAPIVQALDAAPATPAAAQTRAEPQTPRSTIKRRLPVSESPFVPKHAHPSPRPAALDAPPPAAAADSLECSPMAQPQALSAPSPVVPTHSDRRFAHLTGDAAPTVQVLVDFSCTDVVGTAVAVGDYDAQDEDEASFRDGYTVTVHRVDPSGWWDATIDATGERGLVPGNFFRPDEQ